MLKQIRVRLLQAEDYNKGFLKVLCELSPTEMSFDKFKAYLLSRSSKGFRTYVIEVDKIIVGTASIILEEKFLHSGSVIGHIEDVAILRKYQGRGLGKKLVDEVCKVAFMAGAYKCVLSCTNNNVEFYKKSSFYLSDNHMRLDFE